MTEQTSTVDAAPGGEAAGVPPIGARFTYCGSIARLRGERGTVTEHLGMESHVGIRFDLGITLKDARVSGLVFDDPSAETSSDPAAADGDPASGAGGRTYTVRWVQTETREAQVSGEKLADLLGVDVDAIDPDDPLAGARYDLEDTLVEIEDDTSEGVGRSEVTISVDA